MNRLGLRDYQVAFHDAVLREWGEKPWYDGENTPSGNGPSQKTVGDMATSSGKTIAAAAITETVVTKLGGRVLFLADREELIQQPLEKFHRACGIMATVERGPDRASMSNNVVISSVQTLSRQNRLERFPRDHFTHIISDEAHRSTDVHQRIHDHFGNAKVLGITATAFRKNLADLSKWYPTVAFRLGTFDLIDQGYITPINVLTVPLKVDLSNVRQRSGDYDQEQVDSVMRPYYPAIAAIIKEHAAERAILAFLPLIASSKEFVQVMIEEGLTAEHVDGTSDDRAGIKEAFERGDFQILSNSQVMSTGVDFIKCSCLLNLSPTRSRVEYRQRAGRIMRLIPGTIDPGGVTMPTAEERKAAIAASPKPTAMILDLLWQTAKIGLAGPASLIATNEEDEEAITERVRKQRTPEELQEISNAVQRDREEKLRAQLEAAAKRATELQQKDANLIDARQLALDLHDRELESYEPVMSWESQPATQSQKEKLKKLGIRPDGVTKGLAAAVITKIVERQPRGLAPVEAFPALRAKGIEHPETLSLDNAIRVLGTDFPMTLGNTHRGKPLRSVPMSFWNWLGRPDSFGALNMCKLRHPAVYRFYKHVIKGEPKEQEQPMLL